jgi:hypothetical protein
MMEAAARKTCTPAPRVSLVVPLILLCDLVVVSCCLVILVSVFRLPNR